MRRVQSRRQNAQMWTRKTHSNRIKMRSKLEAINIVNPANQIDMRANSRQQFHNSKQKIRLQFQLRSIVSHSSHLSNCRDRIALIVISNEMNQTVKAKYFNLFFGFEDFRFEYSVLIVFIWNSLCRTKIYEFMFCVCSLRFIETINERKNDAMKSEKEIRDELVYWETRIAVHLQSQEPVDRRGCDVWKFHFQLQSCLCWCGRRVRTNACHARINLWKID